MGEKKPASLEGVGTSRLTGVHGAALGVLARPPRPSNPARACDRQPKGGNSLSGFLPQSGRKKIEIFQSGK